jgi:N-succinyldiaminopimelate aminotransferase
MHQVTSRLRPFGTTIFAEMTALAREHDAINLSQGFPDTDGPDALLDAAARALREHDNQYAPLPGLPALRSAIADRWWSSGNRRPDPDTEITVTAGCTEAIAATLLGLLEPGDEVILFEPFYDSYRACVALADATPKFVQLRPTSNGRFSFDPEDLAAAITPKTRAILLNTPHNPTGTVFSTDELTTIAEACQQHDLIAIADEVYEHLVLDQDTTHTSIASLPGMQDRTVTLSSLGKTYSLTGWKIGWAIAPPDLTKAVRSAHQFLTYAIATPLQHAAAFALTDPGCLAWIDTLRAQLATNRDTLCRALADLGFEPHRPQAGYFVLADHTRVSAPKGIEGDADLARALTADARVAAIPPSAFCVNPDLCKSQIRFAFCKKPEVIDEAIARLHAWVGVPMPDTTAQRQASAQAQSHD